jgi:predicted RNA-binding Zn-ribbon protein involved in translation (DUF1610 family)
MPSTRDELVRLVRAEVGRLEAERGPIDAALAALNAVLERYDGKPATAQPAPATASVAKKKGHPAPANHPWRQQVIGTAHDWDLGLRLWREQKSVPDIAKAVGVTEAAVYYQSKKWPRRPEQPRTGRPPKDEAKTNTVTIGAVKRRVLMHSVECPNCGQTTIADPCSRCNTVLPTSLGGVGTSRRAGEED